MSEKNGASPEIGAVLQKILARLDVIEQREQQQDAIEALRGNSGRRGAAAVDGARVDASVDEPASDRGGPSSDASSVASAASTATILVDSLGDPDPKNKNRKHFKFMDSVWTSAFLHPGAQSSLTKAEPQACQPAHHPARGPAHLSLQWHGQAHHRHAPGYAARGL